MPPPRRFSAAPTLTCPHRNKSSSHSSSSLHHAYSIDSSESMITVIPASAGRGLLGGAGGDLKRHSRGSISCNSSGGGGGAAGQTVEPVGAFHAPRSPLSPRSPSRCSPGLMTPNTSEPATTTGTLEPPFSPANTNTTTCSSTGLTTVLNQQQTFRWITSTNNNSAQHSASPSEVSQNHQRGEADTVYSFTPGIVYNSTPIGAGLKSGFQMSPSGHSSDRQVSSTSTGGLISLGLAPNEPDRLDEDDSSLAVENGTSFNSSRHELDELDVIENDDDDVQQDFFQAEEDEEVQRTTATARQKPCLAHLIINDNQHLSMANNESREQQQQQQLHSVTPSPTANQTVDTNLPVVCESINDFCARHTREELEFLIGQISCLEISDCYYSERSSTLCMVIEIQESQAGK